MKKLAGLVAVLVFTGCAGQVAPDTHSPKLAAYPERYCLRDTGTNLRLPEGQCAPAWGRVYTREELDRTGGANLGDSLAHLLPY